ncbi:MAG: hypothetical protein KJO21_00380 [Verrucomicrobiae bacterium]|nr:hypothetical protein [Verrucomicrobiae bacterium]NNJ41989.1 hypothetical protein [Akkermansiaceae bacterium]
MKHSITRLLPALAIALVILSPAIAQKKAEEETPQPIVETWQQFMNLPKAQRQEYSQKLVKAQNLFSQKRLFDTLEKIDELDKIFPDHPSALNLRGACYVEIRSFKKANKIFEKILTISPDNTNVQFNLAEVDFVTKNWTSAYDRFTQLIPRLPSRNKGLIRLCEFKLLLCQLKTGRVKEAIALRDQYDAWDDSPYYYYSRAAIFYHEDNKKEAEKMLNNARFVWRNDAALSAWQDTLIEFGYIRSFYGENAENAK